MDAHLELRNRAVRGMAWSMGATFAGRVISLFSLALLARLLVPEDFGLLAFALVFLTYLETVGDLGTGTALVYWSERWEDAAQLTFVANVVMGLVWVGVCIGAAPMVAGFFGSPQSAPVLRALGWVMLIRALGNTHDAILRRELRFRARLLPEVGLLTLKAVVAVFLALRGLGVWSLVWGQLTGQVLATVLLWILVRWRPGAYLPLDLARPLLTYGRGIISVNVVAAVVHHADIVVVGRVFSAAVLGMYQMAYKVPDIAVTLLVRITSKVLFPALSRLREAGGALSEFYLLALRSLSLLTLPASLGLVMMAEPIVLTVFGEQWAGAVPILRALAVYAGLRALGSYGGDLLKATGRPGLLALLGAARALILVPALLLAARGSATTVAWTVTGLAGLSTAINLAVVCRVLRVSWLDILRAVAPSVMACTPLFAWLSLWRGLTQGWPPPADLALGSGLGIIVYALAVHAVQPRIFRSVAVALRGMAAPPEVAEAPTETLEAFS